MNVRPPAVAGTFYPADPHQLAVIVDAALAAAKPGEGPTPKAVVVPHAGYIYSGQVAANAFAALAPRRESIQRVVLLGPAHRVPVDGLATSAADAFATPLGAVELDVAARSQALALPHVSIDDEAHAEEHSLEVELPFLQRLLVHFRVVPFVVGDARPETVAAVLDALWGGPETVIVVSSDLSHYLDHEDAVARDQATAAAILSRALDRLTDDDACGAVPLRGLLLEACRRDLAVRLIDLRTSGDTAGPRDRVVGYGAFALA